MLPPFTDLRVVQTLPTATSSNIGYGAQDLSAHDSGAYTGEISGTMLAKLGCTYVAVGHSERRAVPRRGRDARQRQGDGRLRERHRADPLRRRGPGDPRRPASTWRTRLAQLDGALEGLAADEARTIVVAYEPVWAIGTGEVATPEDAQEVCGRSATRLAELVHRRPRRRCPDPLRRLRQGVQRRGDHGSARYRRRPGRWGQPRRRGVRPDRQVPRTGDRLGTIRERPPAPRRRRSRPEGVP